MTLQLNYRALLHALSVEPTEDMLAKFSESFHFDDFKLEDESTGDAYTAFIISQGPSTPPYDDGRGEVEEISAQ